MGGYETLRLRDTGKRVDDGVLRPASAIFSATHPLRLPVLCSRNRSSSAGKRREKRDRSGEEGSFRREVLLQRRGSPEAHDPAIAPELALYAERDKARWRRRRRNGLGRQRESKPHVRLRSFGFPQERSVRALRFKTARRGSAMLGLRGQWPRRRSQCTRHPATAGDSAGARARRGNRNRRNGKVADVEVMCPLSDRESAQTRRTLKAMNQTSCDVEQLLRTRTAAKAHL